MKCPEGLYISADLEGVAGVVSIDQTLETGFEYAAARAWMTGEVIAVCDAAKECGVEKIVVSDSHGNGQNLLLDELPGNVEVVRSWPRPLGMMQGIEAGRFLGAVLLGHHCGAELADATLAHTFAGRLISGLRIDGRPASETTVNALIAAHFDTPVIMASGDAAYTDYVAQALPDALTVTTKVACARQSARTRSLSAVRAELRATAARAIRQTLERPPAVAAGAGPLALEVDFQRHKQAELLSYLPMVRRVSGLTVRYEAPDAPALSRFLTFLTSYGTSND